MQKLYFLIFLSIILNCRAIEEENILVNKVNSKKNLIIIAIINYDWDKIAVFFNSYVKAKFENTDCVVYVDNVPEATLNRLKSYGVIIIPFPEELKKVHIFSSRWACISHFLRKNIDKYHLVFTSDVRDAFFQKDVFKYYENINKPFLGLAYENGFLSQENTNKNWIIYAFGEDYYKTLTTERVICMGTLWGTPDKVLQFSDKIFEILKTKPKAIDQAIGNYIIYHLKMFENCSVISENADGPIMSIAITNRAFINLDSNQNIINVKGEIAAYVHQYDRFKDLTQIVNKKYYTKINEPIKIEPDKPKNIQSETKKSDITRPEPIQSDTKKSDITRPEPIQSDTKKSDINKPDNIKSNSDNTKQDNKKNDNSKQENKKDDNTKQDNKKNNNFMVVFFILFVLVSFIIGLVYIYKYNKQLTGKINEEKCKFILLNI